MIDELIDEKVKIKEAKKFGVEPTVVRYRSVLRRHGCADAHHRLSSSTKTLETQGIRPGDLKARLKADMVWTSLVRGRFKESLQVGEKDVNEALRNGGEDKPKTEAFEYQMQPIVLIVPRGAAPAVIGVAAQGSRSAARARADLRRGQCLFQGDAERRDTRYRHQDVGRPAGRASRIARQDADRPSDPAGDHEAGRGDGGRCAARSRPASIRRRRGKSAKRCSPRSTRRSRKTIWRKSANPR